MTHDENKSMFTDKARAKLRSSDNASEYVRVATPSKWVVVAACVFLAAGLITWGLFGTAQASVKTQGALLDGGVVCFLPEAEASTVQIGDPVNVDGEQTSVESISRAPVSRNEARNIIKNEFLASTLVHDDWTYVVRMAKVNSNGLAEGVPLSVTITTKRVAPLELLFKGSAESSGGASHG